MCACRPKRSFLIDDILSDVKKKPYKNLSNEPTKPFICNTKAVPENEAPESDRHKDSVESNTPKVYKDIDRPTIADFPAAIEDQLIKYRVYKEVQNEIALRKANLEQRRNTYPLQPTPVKANYSWSIRGKDLGYIEPRMSYYSEQMLNTNQLLRSQLAANRYATHPFAVRSAYGFDRVAPNCCTPWWGLGGRRKGGQVRFTAAQTGALERRFNASKYLSPDERRALANSLRLSDRQVKTWFQNRRAKWRRTTPDSADPGSPPTSADGSDDDVQIADDDSIL